MNQSSENGPRVEYASMTATGDDDVRTTARGT